MVKRADAKKESELTPWNPDDDTGNEPVGVASVEDDGRKAREKYGVSASNTAVQLPAQIPQRMFPKYYLSWNDRDYVLVDAVEIVCIDSEDASYRIRLIALPGKGEQKRYVLHELWKNRRADRWETVFVLDMHNTGTQSMWLPLVIDQIQRVSESRGVSFGAYRRKVMEQLHLNGYL